ncbi:MAG: class B sortase [Ruminococcaceae bacterium]|nr:class B sortase [Oscillospiraceae bacterium]
MAKKSFDYEMEEYFIKKEADHKNSSDRDLNQKTVQAIGDEQTVPISSPLPKDVTQTVEDIEIAVEAKAPVATGPKLFEQSLLAFSSASIPRRKQRKKKRKFDTNSLVRALALLLCIATLGFSLVNIFARSAELDASRKKKEEASVEMRKTIGDRSMKSTKRPSESMDLLSYLGSSSGGIEMFESLDTDKQVYYETLREIVYDKKKINPDCWGYVVMSDSPISEPIMKGPDNQYYLYRLEDKTANRGGSIFADSLLKDDYEKNRNVVLYGHCMTDGSKFRGIKLFFDDDNRYSIAQDLEITVVTDKAVYVYEYFSGYRAEGDAFATIYSTNSSAASFYQFLMERRRLNTISKDVEYDENSKIITLITCTNLSSKPTERYVLHGILKNTYYF